MNKNYVLMAICAFASVISFFNINSAYGDSHHFNGIVGFLGLGILFASMACYFLYRTRKSSN